MEYYYIGITWNNKTYRVDDICEGGERERSNSSRSSKERQGEKMCNGKLKRRMRDTTMRRNTKCYIKVYTFFHDKANKEFIRSIMNFFNDWWLWGYALIGFGQSEVKYSIIQHLLRDLVTMTWFMKICSIFPEVQTSTTALSRHVQNTAVYFKQGAHRGTDNNNNKKILKTFCTKIIYNDDCR